MITSTCSRAVYSQDFKLANIIIDSSEVARGMIDVAGGSVVLPSSCGVRGVALGGRGGTLTPSGPGLPVAVGGVPPFSLLFYSLVPVGRRGRWLVGL